MQGNNGPGKQGIADLIADDQFLQWVREPNEALDQHWHGQMETNPAFKQTVYEARRLVNQMRFETHSVSDDRRNQLLESIKREAGIENVPIIPRGRLRLRSWMVLAASFTLFAVAGIWLFLRYAPQGGGEQSIEQLTASAEEGTIFFSDGRALPLASWSGSEMNGQVLGIVLGSDTAPVDSLVSPLRQVVRVDLPDGSKVHLNSGTTLRLAGYHSATSRGAGISGQGYFDVAPDPNKPFLVAFDDREVRVLGTSFDVSNYPGRPQAVTLAEGSVEIAGEDMQTVALQPGQQAVFADRDAAPIIQKADVSHLTAWTTGVFSFHDHSIERVMDALTTWYGVEVEYTGPRPTEPISGTIPNTLPLEEVLVVLENAGIDADMQLENKVIRITKK